MLKTSRKQSRFSVFDNDGNRFVIIKRTAYTTVFDGRLPVAHSPGGSTYRLSTGEAVIRLNDTDFQVVSSRKKLYKRSKINSLMTTDD